MSNEEKSQNLMERIWDETPLYLQLGIYILLVLAIIQLIVDFLAKRSVFSQKKFKIRRIFTKNLKEIQDCQRILEITSPPEEANEEGDPKKQTSEEIAKALHLARSIDFNSTNLDCILQTLQSIPIENFTTGTSNDGPNNYYPIVHQRVRVLQHSIEASKKETFEMLNETTRRKSSSEDIRSVIEKTQSVITKALELLSLSLSNNRPYSDSERLFLIVKKIQTRFIEFCARSEVSSLEAFSRFSAYNPIYRMSSFFVLVLCATVWFVKYLFDTDGILVAFREYWYYKPRRRSNDMRRLLHLAWHCSVYIPILAITLVASIVLGIGKDGLFFLCLASSAVSLEICVSVILDKVHHLQDLTRQTTRAIRQHVGQEADVGIRWIKYFQKRHVQERTGVAKAALVTIFSIFLFSIVLGIEVLTLKKHSLESEIVKLVVDPDKDPNDSNSTKAKELHSIIERIYNEDFLLIVAGICSFVLFFISVYKLWVQTRYILEDCDAMDRFETPEEAESEYLAGVRRHDSTEYLNDNIE